MSALPGTDVLDQLRSSVARPDADQDHGFDDGPTAGDGAVLPLWQPSLRERVHEAWESRHLFPALAERSIPSYQGKVLGRAWLVLRPAMQVFGFGVIFAGVFGAGAPNGIPYLLFMVLSLQAFRIFELTILYETLSTKLQKQLTRGLRIPLLLIPVAAISRVLLTVAIYWSFVVILLVYYLAAEGHFYLQLSPKLLVGVAGIVLCVLYGVALGLTTATIFARAEDMRYVVRYTTQLWLFLTPVLYPLSALPHTWQVIAQANPMTPIVGLVQYGFLGVGEVHTYPLLASVASMLAIGLFGLWFFNRYATRWIGLYPLRDTDLDEVEPV